MAKVYKPLKIYVRKGDLLAFDGTDTELREVYGRNWELVNTLKDNRNLDDVLPKLCKQYDIEDVILAFDQKKKWGWKYFTDEEKEAFVKAIKAYRTGRPWEDEVKSKISASRKGRGNFAGHRHSSTSKMLVRIARIGKNNVYGLRWCHNPITGDQKRCRELPSGFVWGRGLEAKDYTRGLSKKRWNKR